MFEWGTHPIYLYLKLKSLGVIICTEAYQQTAAAAAAADNNNNNNNNTPQK
jgi:hypothetical protein